MPTYGRAVAHDDHQLDYAGYAAEIVVQTDLLRARLRSADLNAPVPTCPGWTIGQLARHVGGGHRWAEEIVRTRAASPVSDEVVRDVTAGSGDRDEVDRWLADGSARLSATLRDAGPCARVWTPVPGGDPSPLFYARRMTHETVVHRADATLAAGGRFRVEPDVARDCVDEWLALASMPEIFDMHPEKRAMLGTGWVLQLGATDDEVSWLVDLTGEAVQWRHGRGCAVVELRGPLTELLLVMYRRRPSAGLSVSGDRSVLDHWLELVSFG